MSELVECLRNWKPIDLADARRMRNAAADRIEALEAELREALDLMHKARLSSIHHATDKAALRNRIEALEAKTTRPHELKVMQDAIAYLRSIAQTFPDAKGATFAAKMRAYAQTFEDMVERGLDI